MMFTCLYCEPFISSYLPPPLATHLTHPTYTKLGHNWSPYFKYVVTELEKNNMGNNAVEEREDELRQKIREIIPCNIKAEHILESTKFAPFDIVQTNLCLEAACESKEEFTECLRGLKDLLRPGGYVVCLTAKGGSWYTCAGAGNKLHQLKMEEEDILQAFKDAGK